MKLLFLLCFLLPLPLKANLNIPANGTCHSSFANANKNSGSQQVIRPIEVTVFIGSLQSSETWTLDTRRKVLEALPQLNPEQLILLFKAILRFEIHLQSELFDSPFVEVLMSSTNEQIHQFNKVQLMSILYFYKKIGLKPDETFARSWRQAALKKQREFESLDRYWIRSLFVDLGIPPLNNPHNLNSGYTEHKF